MEFKVRDLFKQYGSPLYVYEYSVLYKRCEFMSLFQDRLEEHLPDIRVCLHYSTKANSNPAILKTVREFGFNVDCMSPLELEINKNCGFTPDRMLYVCNNISPEEMKMVHKNGLLICLDSVSQVCTWGRLYPGSKIMVRINPGVSGVGHSEKVLTGKDSKFGITESHLELLFAVAKEYNLRIIGVHQHLGSLFLEDKIPDYIAGVKAGLEIIKKYFKDVEIVDLGGGFGVPYGPGECGLSLPGLADKLLPILRDFVQSYPSVKEFKFEPGRYIPCEAGNLLGTVTAVEKRDDTWWVGTDIGMNVLIRPAMYGSYHQISFERLSDDPDEPDYINICGNICESGDILGKSRLLPLPKVGSIIRVYYAGAYGYSMASNYTGRPRPAEVMLYEDHAQLIRQRESLEDMMRNIVW